MPNLTNLRSLLRLMVLFSAQAGAACELKPPHAVVVIDDPEGIATDATALYAGASLDGLNATTFAGTFPLTLLVESADEASDRLLVVEARRGDEVVARGSARVNFRRRSGSATTIDLHGACNAQSQGATCALVDGSGEVGVCIAMTCVRNVCGDGVLASGREACDDGNDNPNDGCSQCALTEWVAQVRVGLGQGGGEPSSTSIGAPLGVDSDANNRTYIVASPGRLLLLDTTLRIVAGGEIAGVGEDDVPGRSAMFARPSGVVVTGAGDVYIADTGNHRIRRFDSRSNRVATITGGTAGFADGPLEAARFDQPIAIADDGGGTLYVADSGNRRIRRIDTGPQGGVTTLAGNGLAANADAEHIASSNALAVALWRPVGIAVTNAGDAVFFVDQFTDTSVEPAQYKLAIRRLAIAEGNVALSTYDSGARSGTYEPTSLLGGTVVENPVAELPKGLSLDGDDAVVMADAFANQVVRISSTDVSVVAGRNGVSGVRNGVADAALFYQPTGIANDPRGGIYVTDYANRLLRFVQGDVVSSLAGVGRRGDVTANNGYFASAVALPQSQTSGSSIDRLLIEGVAAEADGSTLVVSHIANTIRRVDGTSGLLSTFMGDGVICSSGACGDGGPAIDALLGLPTDIAVDPSGVVYVAELIANRVRRVSSAADGRIVSTMADESDGIVSPTGLFVDRDGTLWVRGRGAIWRIDGPHEVAVVVGTPGVVCSIPADCSAIAPGCKTTTTAAARLSATGDLVVADDGTIYVSETELHQIRRISGTGVEQFIGTPCAPCNGSASACGDDTGTLTGVTLNQPTALALASDGDTLFIADGKSFRLRRASRGAEWRVDRVAGSIATAPATSRQRFAGDGGAARAAELEHPVGLAVVGDVVLVTTEGDLPSTAEGQQRVRRIDVAASPLEQTDTLCGRRDPSGDGPLGTSFLAQPAALAALDDAASRWLVVDSAAGRVRSVDFAQEHLRSVVGAINGFAASPTAARFARELEAPRGIATDLARQRAYVSEAGSHQLRVVDLSTPTWSIANLAGAAGTPAFVDGALSDARFDSPQGLAIDGAGNVYIADRDNFIVRYVDMQNQTVTTVVGRPYERGTSGIGAGSRQVQLMGPEALALAADGTLYIADTAGHRVLRWNRSDDRVDLVIGDGQAFSSTGGTPASAMSVAAPRGLLVDSYGNLFVTSSTTVMVVAAGDDMSADGNDAVSTIYGGGVHDAYPQNATTCLTGVTSATPDVARLYVLDSCLGLMMQLDRLDMTTVSATGRSSSVSPRLRQ